jgi:hypothetical protein
MTKEAEPIDEQLRPNLVRHCDSTQSRITKAFLKFIIGSMHSFSMGDDKLLLEFIYLIDPRYIVPDIKTVKEYIKKEFDLKFDEVKKLLNNVTSNVLLILFPSYLILIISNIFN